MAINEDVTSPSFSLSTFLVVVLHKYSFLSILYFHSLIYQKFWFQTYTLYPIIYFRLGSAIRILLSWRYCNWESKEQLSKCPFQSKSPSSSPCEVDAVATHQGDSEHYIIIPVYRVETKDPHRPLSLLIPGSSLRQCVISCFTEHGQSRPGLIAVWPHNQAIRLSGIGPDNGGL